jgi:N6-L-threonylcarbamoyladenine synthase
MLVLGIETSCDETAAAVVRDGREIVSSVIASQIKTHERFGGVVPELASREHLDKIVPIVEEAFARANSTKNDIDGIAVTVGPGLIGSLLVGVSYAKAMAFALNKPIVGVNHIEGHIYSVCFENPPVEHPALALIVSGGHTNLFFVPAPGKYKVVGRTRDDAAGEAFDKVARLLGLGFPGGPAIDRLAATATSPLLRLPRARLARPYDFSFSGLKTKVQRIARGEEGEPPAPAALAAAFQESVVDSLVTKAVRAATDHGAGEIILSGGVAANSLLRSSLVERSPVPVVVPPPALCTDNGAMIAAAGWRRLQAGSTAGLDLDVEPGLRIG